MSALATVMYVPLLIVTRHGWLPTHPCVTRLGSALSVMAARGWGVIVCTPSSSPIRRHPLISQRLVILPLPCCFFGHHSDLFYGSRVSWRSFFSFPVVVVVLCLPPVGAVTSEVAWLPTPPTRQLSLVSSPVGAISFPRLFWRSFFRVPGC
jgi:hypothetical protein